MEQERRFARINPHTLLSGFATASLRVPHADFTLRLSPLRSRIRRAGP